MLKSDSIVNMTRSFYMAFGDNSVITNEDTPILSGQKCSPQTLVSGDIRFTRTFAMVLMRGGVS